MEVIIHTVDRTPSKFQFTDETDVQHFLATIHPDTVFGQHQLMVRRTTGTSYVIGSKITFIELWDAERTEWPFHNAIIDAFEVTKQEFEDPKDMCIYLELRLSDSNRLKVRMEPVPVSAIRPSSSYMIGQMMSQPTLVVHGLHERTLLVNGAQIVAGEALHCADDVLAVSDDDRNKGISAELH